LIYFFNSFYALIATFARAINKVNIFAIAGILNTVVHIVGNIVFLVVFDMGIRGYLLASVCASFISAAYVFISIRIDKRIIFKTSKTLSVQMLKYSLPLIPTSISLWVMNSIDRYFIVYMLNVGENGLYTVANHIPSAISTLIALFLQAWQLSTFEEAKSQDRNSYVSEVFSYFTAMLVFCVSITIIFIKPICNILIAPEYLECIYCIPILLLSIIFSSLGSYVGTNYTTEKRTVGIFVTTIMGAVLNIVLNYILTPLMGIKGTAIATVVSFALVFVIRAIGTQSFFPLDLDCKRMIPAIFVVTTQVVLFSFRLAGVFVQTLLFVGVLIIYWEKIAAVITKLYKLAKSKIKPTN
jgi:O-antigen/teichoic acid export membrane protein